MPRLPRRYGQSQDTACPFCGDKSTIKNHQGLPVCNKHRHEEIILKCACGDSLEVKESKFGAYFFCEQCGNIGYKKGLEINDLPLQGIDDL